MCFYSYFLLVILLIEFLDLYVIKEHCTPYKNRDAMKIIIGLYNQLVKLLLGIHQHKSKIYRRNDRVYPFSSSVVSIMSDSAVWASDFSGCGRSSHCQIGVRDNTLIVLTSIFR